MTRRFSACLALVFILAGCGSTGPVPEDRFYQLQTNVSVASVLPQPVLHGGLRVDPIVADPLRGGRAVLYRDMRKPLELQRYHYEFWVDQPPRMIHQVLLHYLRSSGVADSVQDDSRRVKTDYRLSTRLLRFERVVRDGAPKVELELEVSLYSERSGSLLWTGTYLQQQESNGKDMHASARAMQDALEAVLESLLADLSAFKAETR
ncbi:MAG TPA: hypothetical protein ENI74_04110 [Gammaproteobacteria bacterium]|nr:hypothetical protein [Gammaproteobacteria bacterium]